MGNPDCRFCTLPDPDRIVAKSDNFAVMLSLGPIVEGYAVITSRAHHNCCASMPPEELGELRTIQLAISAAQCEVYGSSLYFEHGRSGACVPEGHGEDHCFHAHLHVVPTELDLFNCVSAEYTLEIMPTWSEWSSNYSRTGSPYIAVQAGEQEEVGVATDPAALPRQYLRTRLAELAGEPHLADWQAFPGHASITSGLTRIGDHMRHHLQRAGIEVGPGSW